MASERVTPVQAAKALDIRPQIVYGYIKHGRLTSYPNPDGKTALVELDVVKQLVAGTQHHRPKDPETGKPIRVKASDRGIGPGSILSYHAHMPKEKKPRQHRIKAVTEVVHGETGEDMFVSIGNGESSPVLWEIGYITDKIGKHACMIEPPANILAVLMYHFIHTEQPELAASLQSWCESNNVAYSEVKTA